MQNTPQSNTPRCQLGLAQEGLLLDLAFQLLAQAAYDLPSNRILHVVRQYTKPAHGFFSQSRHEKIVLTHLVINTLGQANRPQDGRTIKEVRLFGD